MSENAASRWAGLRARGLEGEESEAEGMRGRVRSVVAMREGGERAMGGGALGVRGAARSGRGSHLSHGRPGREVEDRRLANDDTGKRGKEGMAGVADEEDPLAAGLFCRPVRTSSREHVLGGERFRSTLGSLRNVFCCSAPAGQRGY